ncbi:MAG: BamA/TamA family outer membrane protein [candidate division Zixibacteria bacterium]|nr:BamA/TamA family outer membrane protein [candidate division Zixibacteria bacterium]
MSGFRSGKILDNFDGKAPLDGFFFERYISRRRSNYAKRSKKTLMNRIFMALTVAIFMVVTFPFLTATTGLALASAPDTTEARPIDPPPQKDHLGPLDIIEELLTLPFYVIKGGLWVTTEVASEGIRIAQKFRSRRERGALTPKFSYGSNSGLELGAKLALIRPDSSEDYLFLKGSYSTNEYQDHYLKFWNPSLLGQNTGLRATVRYTNEKRERFYGIGDSTFRKDKVAYTLENTAARISVEFRPRSGITVSPVFQYTVANLFDGDDPNLKGRIDTIATKFALDTADIRSARLWSLGVELFHDSRNHPSKPTKGGVESFSIHYVRGVDRTDDLKAATVRLDMWRFFELYRKRTLAFRVLIESVEYADASPDFPFYLLPTLGGQKNLRGFRTDRFRDNGLALLTAEYRYPIWMTVDAFLFFDYGQVFNDLQDDFEFRNWNSSYGLGIRVWQKDGVILRTTFGRSDEGSRFYLEFGEDVL